MKREAPRLKYLVTIKKASAITGSSISFFKQLIREKKLPRYKINSATFISLLEFEQLAVAQPNDPWVKKSRKLLPN